MNTIDYVYRFNPRNPDVKPRAPDRLSCGQLPRGQGVPEIPLAARGASDLLGRELGLREIASPGHSRDLIGREMNARPL